MNRHSPFVPFHSVPRLPRTVTTSLATIAATITATITMIAALPMLSMAQTVKMRGTVAPAVASITVARHLDPSQTLTLDIRFALRNRAQLDQLIAAQMNPASPSYHQWITPDEFNRRFGPDDKDFSAVKSWLIANGFQIVSGSREEGFLRFSGDAVSVERVFNTQFEDFGDGKFANLTEPEIPAQFANVIGDVLGMHNLGRLEPALSISKLKPLAHKLPAAKRTAKHTGSASGPAFNLSQLGGSGFTFAAPDFYNFYDENPLLNGGNTGANGTDCIGIFAETNIYPDAKTKIISSYFKFFSSFTSFSTDPSITIDLSKESNPGVVSGADIEAYLDIEASHIIAPGTPTRLYVTNPKHLR
jgi:subtilase family serine protease